MPRDPNQDALFEDAAPERRLRVQEKDDGAREYLLSTPVPQIRADFDAGKLPGRLAGEMTWKSVLAKVAHLRGATIHAVLTEMAVSVYCCDNGEAFIFPSFGPFSSAGGTYYEHVGEYIMEHEERLPHDPQLRELADHICYEMWLMGRLVGAH